MSFLPRRKRRNPKHAGLAVVTDREEAGAPDAPEEPLQAAPAGYDTSYDATDWDVHGEPPAAEEAERTLLFRVPGIDGGPGFTIPPGFPSEWSTDEDTLRDTLTALRGLDGGPQPGEDLRRLRAAMAAGPAAWLRAIMPGIRHPWEALPGRPSFAGIISDPDGLPYAGLYLGDADDDGRMVIDVRDPRWLHELIGAAHEALDALEADGRAA